MKRMALVAALVAFGGCVDNATSINPEPETQEPVTCPWQPPAQVAEVLVAGHHIREPGGYTAGGRYHEFEWSDDLTRLTRLEVSLEWQAAGPLTEQLMIGLHSAIPGPDPYAYGPYEGASPIAADIQAPALELLRDPLQVDFGASSNQTPVGGWTGPEQPATLRIQETYDPCLRRD